MSSYAADGSSFVTGPFTLQLPISSASVAEDLSYAKIHYFTRGNSEPITLALGSLGTFSISSAPSSSPNDPSIWIFDNFPIESGESYEYIYAQIQGQSGGANVSVGALLFGTGNVLSDASLPAVFPPVSSFFYNYIYVTVQTPSGQISSGYGAIENAATNTGSCGASQGPPGGIGCIATLNPARTTVPAAASSGSAELATSFPNCPWTAASNVSWARITPPLSGIGSTTIRYTTDANPSPTSRSGTLTIGGQPLTITQSGADCSRISLGESGQFFGAGGGIGSFEVTAPAGCNYTVTSESSFASFPPQSPSNRSGSSVVSYLVAANTQPSGRTGRLTIAGQTFTVTQAGAAAPSLSCQVQSVANPAVLRSTGHSELLPPIEITCSGRTGGQTFSGDVLVLLNANVTNRITNAASETLDATLTLDSGQPIQGRIEGINAVRFSGVPIASGQPEVNLRMKISNLRAGVTLLGSTAQGSDINATVQLLSTVPVPISNSVQRAGVSRAPLALSRATAREGPASGQRLIPLILAEGFASAFRDRAAEAGGSPADTGTRLIVRISGAPASTQLFAPAASGNNRARLVSANSDGVGGSFVDGTPRPGGNYQQIALSGGNGFAVWEVVTADANAIDAPEFLILVEGLSPAEAEQLRFEALLGPVSTVTAANATAPVPRFADATRPPTLLDLRITGTVQTGSRPTEMRAPVALNSTATFNYRVSNDGDSAASDVVFRSTLSDAFSSGTCTASQGTCSVSGGNVRANLGAVGVGAQVTVTVTAAVGGAPNCPSCVGSGTVLQNTATASAAQLDPTPSNNSTETQVEVTAACQFALSRSSATASGAGSLIRIDVTTGPACDWTQVATQNGVAITPSGALRGSATLSLNVPANPGAAQRVLTINPASQSFAIHQAGQNCSFTLSGPSTLPAAGGSFQLQVRSSCAWTAFGGPDWLRVSTPNTGTGDGIITFTATPNQSVINRTGALEIAGQIFAVTQLSSFAGSCTYSVTPAQLQIGGQGGPSVITVAAGTGCAWTATANEPWLSIATGSSGSGNGAVTATAVANPGPQRTGTLIVAGQSIGVTQAGAGSGGGTPTTGLRFVPLEPCRVMETRPEYNFQGRTGAFGPPFLRANETRTLVMSQSNVCQIPATAQAYVLNVTLVPRGSADFVTIWAGSDPRPNVWTVRSPDGQVVANSTVVKAGGGAIQVYASNDVDVILDISGYFTDSTQLGNLAYYPLTPCRVIDTRIEYRSPPGPFGPPSMDARQTRRFRFPASPCTVPAGAAAYSVTITAVPPGPLAFLTAWPAGGAQPNISNINSPAGRVLANSVIVPASADGSIDVFAFDRTDFLIDINGYFAPDNGQGLFYFPLAQQCRASDTRNAAGPYGGPIFGDETSRTIALPASSCSGIPSNAKGYVVNATALPDGSPMPFLTLWPTGQPRPNASVLNAFQGQVVTNSAIIPAGTNGAIDIFAFRRTHVVLEVSGYFGR